MYSYTFSMDLLLFQIKCPKVTCKAQLQCLAFGQSCW